MTDSQFTELLKHVDNLGSAVYMSGLLIAAIIWITAFTIYLTWRD